MTQEQIYGLSDEFKRFNLQTNRSVEGSGLGMPITYSLVDLMGGSVGVESSPGSGSTFTVRLPQKPHGTDILGEDAASRLQNMEISQMSHRRVPKLRHELMPYGKVLVVDDVEANLYVVEGILQAYDIKVETAENGFQAVEKIKNGEIYDIIFMDHMMPDMDGIEATKIIRDMGYSYPIVALTANALKDAAKMFMNNGFSGFISKPIDIKQIDAYLIRFIHDKHFPHGKLQFEA